MKINKQNGFTLVELLVALLIGLLLTAAIITIYLGSQSTFRASQAVARSQEATRFAMHFLKTDIRQAGYNGCSEGVSIRSTLNQTNANFLPSSEVAIFGWDFAGTNSGNNFNLNYQSVSVDLTDQQVQDAQAANTSPATMWSGQTVQGSGANVALTIVNLPPLLQGLSPIQGSDVVSVSIGDSLTTANGLTIARSTNEQSPVLQAVDFQGNAINTGVPQGGIVSVGDCSTVDTFQNAAANGAQIFSSASTNGALSPDNATNGTFEWQKNWDESAQVYLQTTNVYYVGTGASGSPSLYRYSSNCGLQDPTVAANGCQVSVVELVEGVENMQVKYAEDLDRDGVPDQVISANQVTDFNNVLSVELGLLVRSIGDRATDALNTASYVLAGDVTIDPPDDLFQRSVSNTSIRIHNRGL